MTRVAIYDTKSYDREYFDSAPGRENLSLTYHDFRLRSESAKTAQGHEAICVFVNDVVDRACLAELSQAGVKHVALRCAGFNNVDLAAAAEFGMIVTRVPAYSPHGGRTCGCFTFDSQSTNHRAHNRVREQNFSLSGLVGFDVFGKTVGILGTGKIGRLVAQIFRGFGASDLA